MVSFVIFRCPSPLRCNLVERCRNSSTGSSTLQLKTGSPRGRLKPNRHICSPTTFAMTAYHAVSAFLTSRTGPPSPPCRVSLAGVARNPRRGQRGRRGAEGAVAGGGGGGGVCGDGVGLPRPSRHAHATPCVSVCFCNGRLLRKCGNPKEGSGCGRFFFQEVVRASFLCIESQMRASTQLDCLIFEPGGVARSGCLFSQTWVIGTIFPALNIFPFIIVVSQKKTRFSMGCAKIQNHNETAGETCPPIEFLFLSNLRHIVFWCHFLQQVFVVCATNTKNLLDAVVSLLFWSHALVQPPQSKRPVGS